MRKSLEENKAVDVNAGWGMLQTTPLISAAAYGDLETIKIFLKHGSHINGTDRYGNTA